MQAAASIQPQSAMGLFDTAPHDYLHFGRGEQFDAKKVNTLLALNKQDISRIADVAPSSVRFDANIPHNVRERLEEIANTINMVASIFDGDAERTVTWFKARNPMLGDVSPRDMIRLGRYERLRKFILGASTTRRQNLHGSIA